MLANQFLHNWLFSLLHDYTLYMSDDLCLVTDVTQLFHSGNNKVLASIKHASARNTVPPRYNAPIININTRAAFHFEFLNAPRHQRAPHRSYFKPNHISESCFQRFTSSAEPSCLGFAVFPWDLLKIGRVWIHASSSLDFTGYCIEAPFS